MGKIIAYYRKSITVKGLSDEESVSYQSFTIEKYSKQNNHEIMKSFSDVGYTGSNTNRPELKEMIQYLVDNPNTIDELVLYSIDRLGRDLEGNIETFLTVEKLVGRIYFLSENIDSKHDFFRVYFLLWTAVSEDSKKQLLERTSRGKQSKTINNRNFINGKYALGYTKDENQKLVAATKQNTTDIQERMGLEIVQFIFYAYLFGMSLRQIANKLNEHFGLTRYYHTKWTHKTVRYVLQNDTYCGVLKGSFEDGKKAYYIKDANIEMLVNPLLFELVHYKLKYETVGRRKKSEITIPQFLVCEECATLLQIDNNLIKCSSCESEIESMLLLEDIQQKIEAYIRDTCGFHFPVQDIVERLIIRYEERKISIVSKIEKMKGIQKEIDELESYIPKKRLDEMKKVNRNEVALYMKELYFEESRIEFVKRQSLLSEIESFLTLEMKPYLLVLPYIVFVNLDTNEYNLLFYNYETKGCQ